LLAFWLLAVGFSPLKLQRLVEGFDSAMKAPIFAITLSLIMVQCVLSFQLRVGGRRALSHFQVKPYYFGGSNSRLFSSLSDGEKKRVVFLGTPDVAASTLKRLYEDSQKDTSSYEIVGVITQPPRRRKRKGKLEPSPVGKAAEDLGIPVLHPEKVGTNYCESQSPVVSCDFELSKLTDL
jgi:hypothetical protein